MATETVLNKLTINSVESQEVYQKMQEKGLINEDEIYLVGGDAGEDSGGSDTFWATYGETTYDECKTAYDSGKSIGLIYNYTDTLQYRIAFCVYFGSFIWKFFDASTLSSNGSNSLYEVSLNSGDAWSIREASIPAFPGNSVDDRLLVSAEPGGQSFAWKSLSDMGIVTSTNITKQTLVKTETTPTENGEINWMYG